MSILTIDATLENLDSVLEFTNAAILNYNLSMKHQMQIEIAVEEVYVNIANYAYAPTVGKTTIAIDVGGSPLTITLTFMDDGKEYDPLAKDDPDITLSADKRAIGGLGIFMIKKSMDDISYSYENGKNILVLNKTLEE